VLNRLLVYKSARLSHKRGKEREDKSLDDLSEVETYSDHSSHEQDTVEESSQVYTITSEPNRGPFSNTLPESSTCYTWRIVEEWALGVSQGDEPQSFSDGSSKESWMLQVKFTGTRRDWCIKGLCNGEGIDYSETLAPVAKFASIRLLIAVTAFCKFRFV